MSKVFSTEEFRNQIASWQDRATDPNNGAGIARGLGSVWDRSGTFPATPLETYFKLNSTDTGWARENLVNLRVFNVVRDFGAVGDGVTNNNTPIQNAVNAADAAGGGVIYFPPAVLGYAVYNTVIEGIIRLDNVQNIIFMGDGYNSWIKLTGDALGRIVEVFRIVDLSQRIVFFNMRFNADTLTNFTDQTHWIQLSQSNPPILNANPSDLLVYDCQFDPISGDAIRLLGGNAAFDTPGYLVTNSRILFNTFNTNQFSRSGVSTQREVAEIAIIANWFTQTMAQQIDFEPHLGDGPAEFNILHNIMDLVPATAAIAITLSGVRDVVLGVTIVKPSQRNNCSFNVILNAGQIQALDAVRVDIIGNILDIKETQLGDAGISLRDPQDAVIEGNIIIAENIIPGGFERPAIFPFVDTPGDITKICISDNCLKAIATVNGNVALRLEDCEQCVATGNIIFLDVDTAAGTWTGIQMRAIQKVGQDWACVGNLVIGTRDRLTDGIQFVTQDGMDIHGVVANYNYTRNDNQGIRFNSAGAGHYLDWRACTGNNNMDASVGLVTPPTPDNVGVTIEGSAAPAAQMTTINVAGNPNARVTAPNGSLCTNSQGVAGAVIFTKDSGTGNTGWAIVGPSEFVFGALLGTTATAARFLAPGAGIATESTVQIQMPFPRAGVIRNMRIDCDAGTGGGTNTYTLNINGVGTALSIALLNTASTAAVDTSQVVIAAGALVSMQVTKSVAPTTPQANIVLTIELTG